jgi:hypothetical protein
MLLLCRRMVLFYVFEAVLAAGFLLFRLAINFAPHKFSTAISSEKNPFYRHKKTFSSIRFKAVVAGRLFALTAPLLTDIIILVSEATAILPLG